MKRIKHRKKSRKRVLLAIEFLAFFILLIAIYSSAKKKLDDTFPQVSDTGSWGNKINLQDLYSPTSILLDADTGEMLAEHDSNKRIYPASLTKIMTALLAIENTEDLEQSIVLPEAIFTDLYAQNASMAGFLPGEYVKMKDLLYGILLPSGAECCIAFAEQVAGSEAQFVEMMNQKAEALEMYNTHFSNSTGLHDQGQYSTVKDISTLLQYALKNAEFREVFTSRQYSAGYSQMHPEGVTFYSTMFEKMDGLNIQGGEIIGGKTGYTDESGLCLASLALVNGREYILVTAKAKGTHDTEPYHIMDAVRVYGQISKITGSKG